MTVALIATGLYGPLEVTFELNKELADLLPSELELSEDSVEHRRQKVTFSGEVGMHCLPPKLVVVGIFSGSDNQAKLWRDAARNTWLQSVQKSRFSTEVDVRFLIRGCLDDQTSNGLDDERKLQNDMLVFGTSCDEPKNAIRTGGAQMAPHGLRKLQLLQRWIRWADARFDFKYALKAEQNTFVRMPVVVNHLLAVAQAPYYFGLVHLPATHQVAAGASGRNVSALPAAMDPRFYVMSADLALWIADPPLPLLPPAHAPEESVGIASAIDVLFMPRNMWDSNPDLVGLASCKTSTNHKTLWAACEMEDPYQAQATHERCIPGDLNLWPASIKDPKAPNEGLNAPCERLKAPNEGPKSSNEGPRPSSHSDYVASARVDAVVANPGPPSRHSPLYYSWQAQRHVSNVRLLVADAGVFGPSPFFSNLNDSR
jgi:hypothetical protein